MQRPKLIGCLVCLSLSAIACSPSDSDFVEFDTFRSPDQEYSVAVEMAPKNSFAFSPEVVRLYLVTQDTSERYLLATTSLANDGSKITDRNIRAEWIDSSTVALCLSGAEQNDEAIVIDAAAATFYVESAECID